MPRLPILTYHGVNIAGNAYDGNDHVAFAADLELIHRLGLRIVPVHWVVDQLLGHTDRDLRGCVACGAGVEQRVEPAAVGVDEPASRRGRRPLHRDVRLTVAATRAL